MKQYFTLDLFRAMFFFSPLSYPFSSLPFFSFVLRSVSPPGLHFSLLSCLASTVCTNCITNVAGRINFLPSAGEIGRLSQIFTQTY